jgi:pimeloyl-ACP methyl ester carboxylesterase
MNVRYKPMGRIIVIGLLIWLLSACTGVRPIGESSSATGVQAARATEAPIVKPTPPPTRRATAGATPDEIRHGAKGFGGKVDVGGYRLSFACLGTGSPTVIFDDGLDSPGLLRSIQWRVKEFTRACTYERANTSLSNRVPIPRTSQDMVDDLHHLLANAKIEGPYVLVGWSIAGLNLRLYASQHSADLVGMVLIDPSSPEQTARFQSLLPPESPNDGTALKAFRRRLSDDRDFAQNVEGIDIPASATQVRAAGTLGDLPLVVITAGRCEACAGLPKDLAVRVKQTWQEMQKEILTLSTNSTQIVAERSFHCIQCTQPDLVVEAIRKMVEQAHTQ